MNEPFLAIVIDPHRTMSAGKVEIGCFRTFSPSHIASIESNQNKKEGDGQSTSVRIDKVKDFGAHYHKYYKLETSFFKSSLDNDLLDRLWNEYWIATLSSSPLLSNQK